jgi:hypothetical protein
VVFSGVKTLSLGILGVVSCLLAACGAGLPAEEPARGGSPASSGCSTFGQSLDFVIDNNPATIFWAADSRINPTDPTVDQSKVKLLLEIPANLLPTGTTTARIRIAPILSGNLPAGGHFDTAFQILPVEPADLQFAGGNQDPLTLTIRYDPVACEITSDVESTLVLGRYNTDSGLWQDVCGDLADPTAAVREVSCANADLSFGIFGAIAHAGSDVTDFTPPIFQGGGFSLTSPSRCDTCAPTSIDLEWGPATDSGGSGLKGYWIYVDGVQAVFTSDITATPTVRFTLRSSGVIDTTREHLYQVQAIDNAGNRSVLFGNLRT